MIDYKDKKDLRDAVLYYTPDNDDESVCKVLDNIEVAVWNAAITTVCEGIITQCGEDDYKNSDTDVAIELANFYLSCYREKTKNNLKIISEKKENTVNANDIIPIHHEDWIPDADTIALYQKKCDDNGWINAQVDHDFKKMSSIELLSAHQIFGLKGLYWKIKDLEKKYSETSQSLIQLEELRVKIEKDLEKANKTIDNLVKISQEQPNYKAELDESKKIIGELLSHLRRVLREFNFTTTSFKEDIEKTISKIEIKEVSDSSILTYIAENLKDKENLSRYSDRLKEIADKLKGK